MKNFQFSKVLLPMAVLFFAFAMSCKHVERDENGTGTEEIIEHGPATDPVDSVQDVGSSTDSTSVDRIPGAADAIPPK